jgi:hypothetical protein
VQICARDRAAQGIGEQPTAAVMTAQVSDATSKINYYAPCSLQIYDSSWTGDY